MGINKIIHGNAYELIKEVPSKSVDLIYTDIPYEISDNGGGSLKNKINKALKVELNNNDQLTKGIDYSILDEFVRVLKRIYIYIWCSKEQIYPILDYFVKKGCYYNILVWCKDNPIPFGSSNFLSDIEYCMVFYEKGCEFNNGWEHKQKWFISHINSADKKDYGHPTCKPKELVIRHLLNSTKENDLILDPFVGSGTTCVACKELGRNYLGFEIDDNYYKIACDRLNGIDKNGQTDLFSTDFEQLSLLGDENEIKG